MIGDSNNAINFSHELLVIDRQFLKFPKAFANNSSANIKLLITQLTKIVLSEGFLRRILEPLKNVGLPLLKNVLKLFAKIVSKPLGLTITASAVDEDIQRKVFRSETTTLIISKKETENITIIVKSFKESIY